MFQHKIVLQLIESSGIGGAETVVLELCKRLDKKSFYPIVGLLNDGWLNQQLIKHGIETIIIKNKYPYDPFYLWQLIKIIKKRKIDIIHSHEFMMNVYGTIVALLTNRPNIATIHGKNYFWEKLRRRIAYRAMGYFATKMVAVSEDLKKFIVDKVGIDTKKISIIYNGIDVERFNNNQSTPDKIRLKKELGLNSNIVIGTIGNPYPVKGHIYLIKAASKVAKVYPDAVFFIIGKQTKYMDELKREVSKLNLENNVKFLGFREDIPELLAIMDVFVLSSIEETFSIATIEAMAAKKPVVATKSGGPEEIIIDGKTGFLVPPMDSEVLAEKILTLLRNKELAKKLGQSGSEWVNQKFTVRSMIKNYQRLYKVIS